MTEDDHKGNYPDYKQDDKVDGPMKSTETNINDTWLTHYWYSLANWLLLKFIIFCSMNVRVVYLINGLSYCIIMQWGPSYTTL